MARKPEPRATVITGLPQSFEHPLYTFSNRHSGVDRDHTDLILHPHIDHALGWQGEGFNLTPMDVYQLKDIAYTRAFESWRRGSKICVVVTADFVCERSSRAFNNECFLFGRRQIERILKWELFTTVLAAGLMPDGSIAQITGRLLDTSPG